MLVKHHDTELVSAEFKCLNSSEFYENEVSSVDGGGAITPFRMSEKVFPGENYCFSIVDIEKGHNFTYNLILVFYHLSP